MMRTLAQMPFVLVLIGVASFPAAAGAPPAPAASAGQRQLPDMPLHDPFILPYAPNKTYYLYTSNIKSMTGIERAGTMVYKSRGLHHWEGPFNVFQVPDRTWADPYEAAWAPEVHEFKGRFYLLTTLHNSSKKFDGPDAGGYTEHARGVVVALGDTPDGPFALLDKETPIPPAQFMTLDGTLYVDRAGAPWMVYAHEWVQKGDGTIEAIPIKGDLSAASGSAGPSVQGIGRALAELHDKAGHGEAELCHRRLRTFPDQDRQTADAVVVLQRRPLRSDGGAVANRRPARTVDTARAIAHERQRPRDAISNLRGTADAGSASSVQECTRQIIRGGG